MTGKFLQCQCRIQCCLHWMVRIERRPSSHDDKTRNEYGKGSTGVDVKLFVEVFSGMNTFVGNRGLHEKLHIWADRCSYQSNSGQQVATYVVTIPANLRGDNLPSHITPDGVRGKSSRYICQEAERHNQENFLDAAIGPFDDQPPER